MIYRLINKIGLVVGKESIHDFWRNPDEGNSPENYFNDSKKREGFLKIIRKIKTKKNYMILEIGCNSGRNLDVLYSNGYRNFTGIEINKNALKLMKKKIPEVYFGTRIINKPVEDCIKSFKTNEFDLIYSLAVLEHIHPDSEWIFKEMARIGKSILTIEPEKGKHWRVFERNYKKIFENLGFKQKLYIKAESKESLEGHEIRFFKKVSRCKYGKKYK